MTVAELSIRRPVFAWMMMFAIILFGTIAYQRLGVSYLPDIDYPVLSIRVAWPGAAPEVMEQDIVDPIEERVVMTEGVRQIRSNIGPSNANVILEFDSSTNINSALQEVESYLQALRLPLNVLAPIIRKSNPDDDPIMRIAVYGSSFSKRDLADYVDKNMQTTIQVVSGVGEVSVSGFGQRALRIFIDNDKLTRLDLTAEDVANAVQLQNLEMSSGFLENRQHYYNVRTLGESITPQEIGDILILTRGGGTIYNSHIHIRDVARVVDGLTDQRSIARLDSKEAVTIDIKKQHGFNEVQVADDVRTRLDQLKKNMPAGMNADVVVDYTRFTKKAVDQTQHELMVAGILTSVICFLFLGTWSSSLNVLIAIPTSLTGAFLVLYELHFTLNLFTLLALALAIGIVVDDAIMVLENIVRHFEMGKKRRRAALDGSREITPAAVAATVAVVAIFLPVAFMQGVIGYFFFQFGITITVAVLFSLLEAITLTPMRCSRMLTPANKNNLLVYASESSFGYFTKVYKRLLKVTLRNRGVVLFFSAVLFGVSCYGLTLLRHEFVPPQDQNFFHITFEAPLNASIYYTDEKAKLVEDYLRTLPEVDHYLSNTSGHNGTFDVVLKSKSKRTRSQADIILACRTELLNSPRFQPLKCWFSDLSGRGLSGGNTAPIAFSIQGPDYDTIYRVTTQITDALTASGKIIDLNTDYRAGVPEEEIIPDRAAAAARGVSVDSIANTISIAIGGAPVGKFTSGGHRYDVVVQADVSGRDSIDDIQRLMVRNNYGELIPMTAVSSIHERSSVLNETRINRLREIGVTGNIAPGVSQGDALALAEKVSRAACPANCQFSFQGSGRSYQDTFSGLWFALILGIIVAYMVLAAQFDSFIHPISVLMALPFSLTGAVLALYMTNQSLNLFSMIGLILLMGLAKKNSILLVEFTNHVRAQDKRPLHQALLDACPIRFRPIMMTSLATISSAIPSALGLGPGSETRVPMAIAVIGGVFVSTLFTLFVVPCTYSVLANFEGTRSDDEDDDLPPPPSRDIDDSDSDPEPKALVH